MQTPFFSIAPIQPVTSCTIKHLSIHRLEKHFSHTIASFTLKFSLFAKEKNHEMKIAICESNHFFKVLYFRKLRLDAEVLRVTDTIYLFLKRKNEIKLTNVLQTVTILIRLSRDLHYNNGLSGT